MLFRSELMERGQAEALAPLIDACMTRAGVAFNELARIAVTIGPGSFTGVRIAAGVVQGLSLGLDCPVIPISTLAAMAFEAMMECDADQGGPTSSNYALFPFKQIRRPVYPLDESINFDQRS